MHISVAAIHAHAASLMIMDPRARIGQAYFVALSSAHAEKIKRLQMTSSVTGTSFDPFNNDANLERFLAYLRYQLGEFDDEIAEVQHERRAVRVKPSAKLCEAYSHRYRTEMRGTAYYVDENLYDVLWDGGKYEDTAWSDYYTGDEIEVVAE